MSSHSPNRVSRGVREGGQFTTGAKNETTVALAEHDLPIELEVGEEYSFDADGSMISHVDVHRTDKGTYQVEANMTPDTLTHLLDAEDLSPENQDEVLTGPRINAATRFLNDRFLNTEVQEGGEEHDLVWNVRAEFDHPPTQAQAVDAVWPTVARIHDEGDRGTFGAPFMGSDLAAHLDAHAFVDRYPLQDTGGRWWPAPPMPAADADAAAADSVKTGRAMSDAAAQRTAMMLSEQGQEAFTAMRYLGCMSREEINRAATQFPSVATEAMRIWASAQPTTSRLIQSRRPVHTW